MVRGISAQLLFSHHNRAKCQLPPVRIHVRIYESRKSTRRLIYNRVKQVYRRSCVRISHEGHHRLAFTSMPVAYLAFHHRS